MCTVKNMDCLICGENFNKSTRMKITCMYCSQEACRSCCARFIETEKGFACMDRSCEKIWTRKFMSDSFTKVYMQNTYRTIQEDKLFDVEKALFPYTQSLIEAEKVRDEIYAEYRLKVHEQEKQRRVLDQQIRALNEQRAEINQSIVQLYRERDIKVGNTKKASNLTRNFVRKCPCEDCRGFLSSHWKCGLCDKYTCPDCHVVIGLHKDKAEHVCKEEDVATAQLINSDTKPCPKCGEGIFKIEGCDQMWCTQCRTGFSWRTGRIETQIHNPHFYEWQRRNNGGEAPRNHGDNAICGEEIDNHYLDYLCNICNTYSFRTRDDKALIRKVSETVRGILHLTNVTVHTYHQDHLENNQDERISYLKKNISLEHFRKEVQRKNKAFEKSNDIHQVLVMFTRTASEILLRLLQELRSTEDYANTPWYIDKHLKEINVLNEYANECFQEIACTYNSVPKQIDFSEYNVLCGCALRPKHINNTVNSENDDTSTMTTNESATTISTISSNEHIDLINDPQ